LTASSFIQKGVNAATQGNLTEAEFCFRQAFLLAKDENGRFNLGGANLIRLLHQQNQHNKVASIVEELGIDQALKLPQICILMAAESTLKAHQNNLSENLYSSLHSQYPQEKSVVLGFSQILLKLGKLDQAKEILEDYVLKHGNNAEVASNLAVIGLEKGDLQAAEVNYRRASSLAPEKFVTHYNLGKYLQMHGELDEAMSEFNMCLEIVPTAIEAMIAKAETLTRKGQDNESREMYLKILEGNAINKEQSIAIFKPLIADAIEQVDWDTCKQYLSKLSDEIRSDFRLRTIIYDLPEELQNEFGDGTGLYDARKLVDSKNFIDDPEYLERITQYVLMNKTLIKDRPEKPTRGGRQTHEIMGSNNNQLDTLKADLESELIKYANGLPQSIKPIEGSRFRVSGWAVSLESGGHQLRHSHPEAVVSGVLYLSIPTDMNMGNDDKQGSLYFSNGKGKPEQESMIIKPTQGKLVMFPSYMPHETIPFESAKERISLAVNLIQIKG